MWRRLGLGGGEREGGVWRGRVMGMVRVEVGGTGGGWCGGGKGMTMPLLGYCRWDDIVVP